MRFRSPATGRGDKPPCATPSTGRQTLLGNFFLRAELLKAPVAGSLAEGFRPCGSGSMSQWKSLADELKLRAEANRTSQPSDLALERERLPEVDPDLLCRLRTPAHQHHAQDAVDAEPRVPEAGVGVVHSPSARGSTHGVMTAGVCATVQQIPRSAVGLTSTQTVPYRGPFRLSDPWGWSACLDR
jgi:hypothetical protein